MPICTIVTIYRQPRVCIIYIKYINKPYIVFYNIVYTYRYINMRLVLLIVIDKSIKKW